MELEAKIVVGFIMLLLLLVGITRRGRRNDKISRNYQKEVPVPTNLVALMLNFNSLYDFITEQHRRHRTFKIRYPTFNYIYTADPENIEYVLKTNFANFGKGKQSYEILGDLLGDGIFTVDGDLWRQQRKRASVEFSTKVLRDFSSNVFKENTIKLCRVLMEVSTSQQSLDLQSLLLKSTMSTICKVGFGIDIHELSEAAQDSAIKFAFGFDYATSLLLWRVLDPLWKLKRYFNLGAEAKMKECINAVDTLLYQIIHKRWQEISQHGKPDILSRFMADTENESQLQDAHYKYLRDVVLNFMIAGRDTTAITLCWFFYCLCKNPYVEAKIVAEIRSLIEIDASAGTFESSLELFSEKLTFSVLDNMHYLHAALSETLRLYPAVPRQSKSVFSDDVLPDGSTVKKGDRVTFTSYAMGRQTYLWGSDAEVFRPERWLDKNGIFQPKSPFLFVAFQAGPRICLGKDFAYIQMKTLAAFLLNFFKFELVQGKQVHYQPSLTLHMTREGLNLHVKPRF